ncbi:MAG: HAD family phosphatase [Acidobacteriaceae bacterium]|nr:HAD family phosphatase [Acidobacteriaceae bacterium]MBV9497922.1 HAD family phosphatase [Acidobacteriaceae bacterium]
MGTEGNRQLAMIFDLDGVLVHSMPLHVTAWEQYLTTLGVQVDNMERRMHGKRNSELVRDLMGTHLADDVVFEHGAAKERLFRDLMLQAGAEQYSVPGLRAFLERHADVPKAIGSNAELANIDFVLDELGLRQFFPVIVNGLQVSRPKPFPDVYLEAAAQLKMQPGDCIVFEDSPTGVDAARAAGMRVVGIETTPTQFEGVDLHVKDFVDPQLERWLGELR